MGSKLLMHALTRSDTSAESGLPQDLQNVWPWSVSLSLSVTRGRCCRQNTQKNIVMAARLRNTVSDRSEVM